MSPAVPLLLALGLLVVLMALLLLSSRRPIIITSSPCVEPVVVPAKPAVIPGDTGNPRDRFDSR